MGQINVLDISVANLIAAGEVVERPASAVKELVENSIDAGAKQITVEIQKGGVAMFRVTDDGCGMSSEDAVLSVKRHATSKIRTEKDLNQIITLGFRGEALAAISAVTKFRMLTKQKGSQSGTLLSTEYGSSPKVSEAGCPEGTTIVCEQLFATTPARLKFLKADISESREVQSAVEKEAVSHPEIAFRFISDGAVKFSSNGNGKLSDAIYAVYGKEFAHSLTDVLGSSGGITVTGYVSSPAFTRGNRGMQIFFVNDRPVRSKTLTAALEQAYESYIPSGKFPSCVLNVQIHSAYVDVNIHPSKLEVKFSDERNVFSTLYYAVRTSLENNLTRPGLIQKEEPKKSELDKIKVTEAFVPIRERGEKTVEQLTINTVADTVPAEKPKSEPVSKPVIEPVSNTMTKYSGISIVADDIPVSSPAKKPEKKAESSDTDARIPEKTANAIPEYKIAGEIFDSYVAVETGDSVILIDKHAAHERINFEILRANMKDLTPHSQLLLTPVACELSGAESETVQNYKSELESVGFVFEVKDARAVITGVPIGYGPSDGRDLFDTVAGELIENGTPVEIQKRNIFEKALYQTSCKMSIKAGRHYDDETLKWIVDNIFRYDCIKYCPHGRPVAFEMKKRELDARFGRIK